ncbi:MAG: tRNA lysidine(34) synthetase TilS [Clostridia bacterium]|nr:tRNA lysidine(34) synthetase TilS [Clostridia bacterium]
MFSDTSKIVIGLSGGADSVVLTHILNNFASVYNFKIIAVHVNHNIRGSEAERDEKFVQEFCESLGIELIIKRENILEISKNLKISTEEAGRITRYKIFNEISSKYKNCKIATAHTLSDNIETVIMRLLSGTGLKGLCGIPTVRDNIIRPLINITRTEIENYCDQNNLKYVQDSSNFGRDYTRNKIRLDIIPEFKKINPEFEICINRVIENLNQDEKYLSEVTNSIFENLKINNNSFDINKIRDLNNSIKTRVVHKIINFYNSQNNILNSRVEQKHINNIIKILDNSQNNIIKKISIPGDNFLVINNNILKFEPKNIKIKNNNILKKIENIQDTNILTEFNLAIKINIINNIEYELLKTEKNTNNLIFIDCDKININKLYFRNRLNGDKFEFKNRNITKSVKKIFNEYKIPVNMRDKILILESDKNIVWIDNIGVSRNYVVNNNTKKIMVISKQNIKEI